MGKFKDMLTKQSEEPSNVAYFDEYDRTTDFNGDPVIDTEDHGEPDPQPQVAHSPKPRTQSGPEAESASARTALTIGNLVAGMDLNDPAHVAELAARYMSMNESMKRLAQEKASLTSVLEQAESAVESAGGKILELQRDNDELGKELAHAKDKLVIATKSSGAIFERTMFSILKWGGIGSILIFASAFFYF